MPVHEPFLNSLTNVDSAGTKLGEMAAKIATGNFDIHFATFVFFKSTLWCCVGMFLSSFNYNLVLNNGAFNQTFTGIIHQHVLFGMKVADIKEALDQMQKYKMDNTGKFIIVCQSTKQKECDEANVMDLFWERNIINVIFIKIENARPTAYTYSPLSENNCKNLQPIKLNSSHCSNDVGSTCRDIYVLTLKNLYSCPLIVSTFQQMPYMYIKDGTPRGADGDLLRIIADTLNATIIMKLPHRGEGLGWRLDNGTWMGSLADIHEDLANISMTSAALTLARISDVQISNSYFIASIGWVTHPAIVEPVALKLFHPFKPKARVALLSSFVVLILCAILLRTRVWTSICNRLEAAQPTKSLVFYAWMICMGQGISKSKFPLKPALLQITLLWIFYCFLIRNAYQVYLISSLKGKFYENQFEKIEDAILANYQFGGGRALKDYYIDYPQVYNNWIDVEAPEQLPIFKNISRGMKFVLAMNLDTANFYTEEFKTSVHILPQRVVLSPTSIFFKKYSPLSESMNVILTRLSSSGFPDKFHKKYTTIRHSDQGDNEEEIINIHHLTACYIMLNVGWAVSMLFFLLEIYFGKIYKLPVKSQ